MKYLTIALIFLASFAIACKKETKQKCYWEASSGTRTVYVWNNNKPSNDQVKKVQDTCSCTMTVTEHCFPCGTTVTNPYGGDVECK